MDFNTANQVSLKVDELIFSQAPKVKLGLKVCPTCGDPTIAAGAIGEMETVERGKGRAKEKAKRKMGILRKNMETC